MLSRHVPRAIPAALAGAALALLAACAARPDTPEASSSSISTPSPTTPDSLDNIQTNSGNVPADPRPISRVVLKSGLVVEDLAMGSGSLCTGPDVAVTVVYTGTLPNGHVFDAASASEPATLPLNRLIEGWQDGLPGMRIGGKRRLTIPAELAYGRRGLRDGDRTVVPPDSDVIYEVELLGVR